ncbi:MAG: collagenase [Ardenticatenaceae bacterium]
MNIPRNVTAFFAGFMVVLLFGVTTLLCVIFLFFGARSVLWPEGGVTPVVESVVTPTSTSTPRLSGPVSTVTPSLSPPTAISGGSATPTRSSSVASALVASEIGATFVKLSWPDKNDREDKFVIYYSSDGFNFLNHGSVPANVTDYRADGLACGGVYHFQIHPRDASDAWLDASNIISVETAPCPNTPTPVNSPSPVGSDQTRTPVVTVVVSCADLERVETAIQILIVESGGGCQPYFLTLLENDPERYLEAFYTLISSSATDVLFSAVYDEVAATRFQFSAEVVDELFANLPQAVAACTDHARCSDWSDFVLPKLYRGDLYRCPDLSTLNEAQLLESLPYGNYACTEAIAQQLAPLVSEGTITKLVELSEREGHFWARRNAVRVLGRLAQQPATEEAHILVTGTYSPTVQHALTARLEDETSEEVVHDAIWVLDTAFYPYLPMQPQLEAIADKEEWEPTLRFRALGTISRLLYTKSTLMTQSELDFLTGLLESDDLWMRAQAAFVLEVLRDDQVNGSRSEFIVQATEAAWADEEELIAKAYMARLLDRYQESDLHEQLREEYEAQYLANSSSGNRIMIRSGLPENELPAFITLMSNERKVFFDFIGLSFDTPVPGDLNDTITLILFATKEEYREYMNAFIGYGAHAGGLYLEKDGILYTYHRKAGESRYTTEELVKHEFAHYLQGRYIFPGLWTDPTYHQQIKGWADEGLAEFFASFTFDENGNYTYTAREAHLDTLCGKTHRDLTSLLSQNEGYNQTGTFDYANGWSFIFYMMTQRSYSAINLFNSFRDDTYKLENFDQIAGVPISNLQQEWHSSLDWWCTVSNKEGTTEADFTHGYSPQSGTPLSEANENIILHLPYADLPRDILGLPPE